MRDGVLGPILPTTKSTGARVRLLLTSSTNSWYYLLLTSSTNSWYYGPRRAFWEPGLSNASTFFPQNAIPSASRWCIDSSVRMRASLLQSRSGDQAFFLMHRPLRIVVGGWGVHLDGL